ncbi:MAG: hypothetical protein U1F49_03350 [Rubrivivax sp.]
MPIGLQTRSSAGATTISALRLARLHALRPAAALKAWPCGCRRL